MRLSVADDADLARALHPSLMNSMVTFYGHHGDIALSEALLRRISDADRDIVSVNAMLTVYVAAGCNGDALWLYEEALEHNAVPDVVALNACGHLHDLACGRRIHGAMAKHERLRLNVQSKMALVDMYGKCGALDEAIAILEGIAACERNMVCVNVMMGALCSNRANTQCIALFRRTLNDGVLRPTLTSPKRRHQVPPTFRRATLRQSRPASSTNTASWTRATYGSGTAMNTCL